MFFNNDKIRAVLQTFFGWSDDQLASMMQNYYSTLHRLILNTCMDYIEEQNLPEKDEFNRLLQDKKAKRSDPKVEAELVQYLAKLPGIYPELEKLIKDKINSLDESIWQDTMKLIDEPTAIELLKIMNADLDAMEKFGKTYLAKNPQTT